MRPETITDFRTSALQLCVATNTNQRSGKKGKSKTSKKEGERAASHNGTSATSPQKKGEKQGTAINTVNTRLHEKKRRDSKSRRKSNHSNTETPWRQPPQQHRFLDSTERTDAPDYHHRIHNNKSLYTATPYCPRTQRTTITATTDSSCYH